MGAVAMGELGVSAGYRSPKHTLARSGSWLPLRLMYPLAGWANGMDGTWWK
jgi:hypothetical protein